MATKSEETPAWELPMYETLNERNTHPALTASKVVLDESTHVYTDPHTGEKYDWSISSFVALFAPPFNAAMIANNIIKNNEKAANTAPPPPPKLTKAGKPRKNAAKEKPKSEYANETSADAVVSKMQNYGNIGNAFHTAADKFIEWLSTLDVAVPADIPLIKRMEKFTSFIPSNAPEMPSIIQNTKDFMTVLDSELWAKNLRPFRTETAVFVDELKLPGTFDVLLEDTLNPGLFHILDWKTSKDDPKKPKGKLFYPFHELPDCKLSKYLLQVELYAYALHKKGMNIGDLYVATFMPQTYSFYKKPFEPSRVEQIIKFVETGKRITNDLKLWNSPTFALPAQPSPQLVD